MGTWLNQVQPTYIWNARSLHSGALHTIEGVKTLLSELLYQSFPHTLSGNQPER
ncbi:hypothetical protein M378DRAFT_98551 [Amanita muscaria Koide BX008]|uniref:Uncharacterized protein n=1 Tax=Amanita muscaria (strain Koide BX008) TaxID=946122 RepID=A0A0C2TPS0_AMAMK|nr:hypothetical protein M378DRAFT_98551 [Amanita muscaria Koide BX008]